MIPLPNPHVSPGEGGFFENQVPLDAGVGVRSTTNAGHKKSWPNDQLSSKHQRDTDRNYFLGATFGVLIGRFARIPKSALFMSVHNVPSPA